MNPSFGALQRILQGIRIGMSDFFSYEIEPEQTVFYAADILMGPGLFVWWRAGPEGYLSFSRNQLEMISVWRSPE